MVRVHYPAPQVVGVYMTKTELEQYCERLAKESNFYQSILYEIKKELVGAHEVFSKGLAEESAFNLGVQHTLDVVADIINEKVSETSYLHCPSFRNIVKEERQPTFTIIEGGLSKKKGGLLN